MRVSRAQVVVAIVCATWEAVFLIGDGAALVVSPALTLASLVFLPARPALGAVVALAATLSLVLLGVSSEDAAGLVPSLVSSYSVGRYATSRTASWFLPAYAAAGTASAHPWLITLVFGLFLSTAIWTFGRLVQRRTHQAEDASTRLASLRSSDPDERARAVVAAERQRLRGEIVAVVRTAVSHMHADAVASERRFDPARVAAIQSRGASAIADMRRLLGLLREEPDPRTEPSRDRPSTPLLIDSVAAAGVAVVMVFLDPTVGSIEPPAAPLPLAMILAVAFPLAWRRSAPIVAATSSACALLAAAALEVPIVDGFGALVMLLLYSWTLGSCSSLAAVVGGALLIVSVVVSWGRENLLFNITVMGLAAFAGQQWSERDRAFARAHHSAVRLQSAHDDVVARAVSSERLRLARELHDVTSHAVGVMVLQAGAAAVKHPTDPAGAAEALRIVSDTGARALGELHALLGVFESPPEPRTTISDLVDRLRATGQPITLDERSTPDGEAAAVAYRIVQESLTNAVRHAPGASVTVTVRAQGDTLLVDVRNGEPARGPLSGPVGGFGLVGLSERVGSLGGEFTAGPDGGGFRVTATLPARVREST